MISLKIPDKLLIEAVSDACTRQLQIVKNYVGYVDLKGACHFLSVGPTQFKEWVKLGYIHPRKVSSHLVRFHIEELRDFMEQFKIVKPCRAQPTDAANKCLSSRTSSSNGLTDREETAGTSYSSPLANEEDALRAA